MEAEPQLLAAQGRRERGGRCLGQALFFPDGAIGNPEEVGWKELS